MCNDGHRMGGVLALPEGEGGAEGAERKRRPGVLLIHDIFGLGEEMKRVARELAEDGYAVLIPSLYDRGNKVICVARTIQAMAKGEGQAVEDLEAARRWLAEREEVDADRLGVIGFCMGGAFTLILATQGKYQAAAPFYGQVPEKLPRACPVVGSFGRRDGSLPGAAAKLERQLEVLGVEHDVKEYPEAGHSFYTRPENFFAEKVGPLLPLHAEYDAPAAQDARERVVAFFKKHLG
ncbi:putative hydrolase [Chondromyces apiculatus DSM 436]|uniref:Putative hydrolase n=1 Tax=Chondromyces apiculatus DSM 436 TaxID=1192034 RepID=A0A017ST79_9BACT|nr:putative hydrolase [Chondromyces apiculatus DSM 436]